MTVHATAALPSDHTEEFEGLEVRIVYRYRYSDYVVGDYLVDYDQVKTLLEERQELTKPVTMTKGGYGDWVLMRGSKELFRIDWFLTRKTFGYAEAHWLAQQALDEIKRDIEAQYAELTRSVEQLRGDGYYVGKAAHLLNKARLKCQGLQLYWDDSTPDTTEVHGLFATAENEINRLLHAENRGQLLIDDLIKGGIAHKSTQHNKQVLNRLRELSIRTGSEVIEMIDEAKLGRLYAFAVCQRVGELSELTYGRLMDIDLRLDIREFMFDEATLDDLGVELAPREVEVQGRKSSVTYSVSYDTVVMDGEEVPIGIIEIPLSVYERNTATYGKKASFPELPHGIRLYLHLIENQQQTGLCGFDDERLARKVKQYKGGKRRGKNAPDLGVRRRGVIQGTEVPPWHVGPNPRWR